MMEVLENGKWKMENGSDCHFHHISYFIFHISTMPEVTYG
jgi:hypothetical protein